MSNTCDKGIAAYQLCISPDEGKAHLYFGLVSSEHQHQYLATICPCSPCLLAMSPMLDFRIGLALHAVLAHHVPLRPCSVQRFPEVGQESIAVCATVEIYVSGIKTATAPELDVVIRGISTVATFSAAIGAGNVSRFPTARSLMSYLSLAPSESSSVKTVSRGAITHTGNTHMRALIVESARRRTSLQLSERHRTRRRRARLAGHCRDCRRDEPPLAHALHPAGREGKRPNVANVAVTRKLARFVWALAFCEG